MRRHGDPSYPVIGETLATSGELISAIRTAFPMLPDADVVDAIEKLRSANDLYGDLLTAESDRQHQCKARSWQLEGHAICRLVDGHEGGHQWEVQ